MAALLHAAVRRGIEVIDQRVTRIDVAHGRALGATLADGRSVSAGSTVLAAGAWSREVTGLENPVPVRPVKGQTLRLQVDPALLGRVIRGTVRGNPVYLVPRVGGELVIGASSEEAGFDLRARAGAVYDLLRDAQALVPELSEAEFREVSTSVRPGSPDNAPLLGRAGVDHLVIATGHYRNGILLAPVTADELARLILDGAAGDIINPFDPGRQHPAAPGRSQQAQQQEVPA